MTTLAALAALALTGTALAEPTPRISPAKLSPEKAKLLRTKPLLPKVDPSKVRLLTAKPDLAITAVSVRRSPNLGKTNVRVSVKNVGRAHWRSAPNQQVVMAYINGKSYVVSRNIKSLDASKTRKFVVEVPSQWAVGLEFVPDVDVRIVFDPDIRLDGNRANDDANPANNRRVLSGTQANAMVDR